MSILDKVTGFLGIKKANGEWNLRNIALITGGLALGATGNLGFLGLGDGAGAMLAGAGLGLGATKVLDMVMPSGAPAAVGGGTGLPPRPQAPGGPQPEIAPHPGLPRGTGGQSPGGPGGH